MKKIYYLILAVLIYRMHTIYYSYGDEAFYNNAGYLLLKGVMPYRDYFLAHPPLLLSLAPFTLNLYTIRLGTFLIQSLILIVTDKILRLKNKRENERLIILIMLSITPAFIIFYNLNLGFGTMTLLCLLSYLAYLKGHINISIIIAGLALMTRTFALFYILAMTLNTWKNKRFTFVYSLLGLGVLVLLMPSLTYNLGLYHFDSNTGKTFMHLSDRLELVKVFLLMNTPWLIFLIKPDYELALITITSIFGIFSMTNIFFMYTSIITPWIILASMLKFKTKQLIPILILELVLMNYLFNHITNENVTIQDMNNLTQAIKDLKNPVTGNMAFINLVSWVSNNEIRIINSTEEPYAILDTLYHRFQHKKTEYNTRIQEMNHTYLCIPSINEELYATECSVINKTLYTEVMDYSRLFGLKVLTYTAKTSP